MTEEWREKEDIEGHVRYLPQRFDFPNESSPQDNSVFAIPDNLDADWVMLELDSVNVKGNWGEQ